MSYGNKDWQQWVLEDREAIEHIKEAFAMGINISSFFLSSISLATTLISGLDL